MTKTSEPLRAPRRMGQQPAIKRPFRVQIGQRFSDRAIIRSAAPVETPEKVDEAQTAQPPGWEVTVFNNDSNTYEEVITVLQAATGCDSEEAYIEAWEIDHFGACVVHRADESECSHAADVIRTIGIRVEVGPAS